MDYNKKNKNDPNTIGYIIIETAPTLLEPIKPKYEMVDGRVEFDSNLQDANVKNRNGRWYDDKELFPQLWAPRQLELMRTRNFFGEAGHPTSTNLARQQTIDPLNRNHLILKMWTDGNIVRGRIRAAATAVGDDFQRSILDGSTPAFSLRALGSVQNTTKGAEVKGVKIITYDYVIFPSHNIAYGDTEQISKVPMLQESAGIVFENNLFLNENDSGLLIPINNEKVIDYIKTESKNIKTVIESLELFYKDIKILDNKRQVKLTTESGSSFVINLENHIRNEIMDWCDKK